MVSKRTEYMRKYMNARLVKRRAMCVELLGGKCARCTSINILEFDHIDPKTKSFNIGGALSSMAWELLEPELKKCQLLCKRCHQKKNLVDGNMQNARTTHGTLSSYRYCKCGLCRLAKSRYNKKQRLRGLKR
ncbi:MAG: hypothetical protein A2Y38_17095 [Spirochaetes bacterium GWB1_59_5]|nr:MAG: hypothetical protein A2Y38_17095 [Spirochaetes bacterium GWB1_59_5]